jgi:hypothetical protein
VGEGGLAGALRSEQSNNASGRHNAAGAAGAVSSLCQARQPASASGMKRA